jgi:hypothetical protein
MLWKSLNNICREKMSNILFISNGHGEDLISLRIIHEFISIKDDNAVFVLPMIGEGKVFSKLKKVTIIGPQKETSSGGFVKSISSFTKDLFSGILFLHFKQIKNASKQKYDLVVCVGDFFPFMLSYLFLKYNKIVLVSTAKSDHFESHFWIERFFFKRAKAKVFARDRITADNLVAREVNATYLGNVMMDGLEVKRQAKKKNDKFVLGILPGSRLEAYKNYGLIKKVVLKLPKDWIIKVAVSSNMEKAKFMIEEKSESVFIVGFEELLTSSDAVIGLAGTANEQVIGFGIPLFTFPGYGPQTTRKRFVDQKKLLGDLPEYINSQDTDIIAKIIKQKVKDPEFMKKVAVDGIKVMGKSGASQEISSELIKLIKQ